VAPNLYYWGRRIRCLISTVRLGERPRSDLDTTRRWLAEHERCTGKIGVIGFCMGGDFALVMAPRPGVSAASVNYGGATDDLERALPDVCPIVGSYGAKDRWPGLRRVPGRLESMLNAARVEHEIKVYPDAGHGFINDHDPAELPLWVKAIAKLVAAGYHEPSARDARRRIVAFFDTHLKP
jgi:carboxymethylenebutenolidase